MVETIDLVTTKADTVTFTVLAGNHLRVETSPAGDEIMDGVVPTGKSWEVTMTVYITETDA